MWEGGREEWGRQHQGLKLKKESNHQSQTCNTDLFWIITPPKSSIYTKKFTEPKKEQRVFLKSDAPPVLARTHKSTPFVKVPYSDFIIVQPPARPHIVWCSRQSDMVVVQQMYTLDTPAGQRKRAAELSTIRPA